MALYMLVNIGSGNLLYPISCPSLTLTNADFLSTGTKYGDILIQIQLSQLMTVHFQMFRPQSVNPRVFHIWQLQTKAIIETH